MSRPLPDDGELRAMLDALRDRGLDDLAELVLELVAAERERVAFAAPDSTDEITPLLLAGYLHGLAGEERFAAYGRARKILLHAAAMLARLGESEAVAEFIEEEIDPPTRD